MIQRALVLTDLILVPEAVDCFTDTDAKKFSNISLAATAVRMKDETRIFVFANGKDMASPVVCRIQKELNPPRLLRISPTIRHLLFVDADSKCEIVPLAKFTAFVKPESINGFVTNDESALSTLGFTDARVVPSSNAKVAYYPNYKVANAFWFESSGRSLIIFVEVNGLHIFDVYDPDCQVKFVQVPETYKACFTSMGKVAHVAMLSPACVTFVEITLTRREVVTTVLPDRLAGMPVRAQFGFGTDWYFAMLKENRLKVMKRDLHVKSEKELLEVKQFVLTKHFLWTVTSAGVLKSQFLSGTEQESIMSGVLKLQIVDAESDEVLVKMKNRIVHVTLRDDLDRMCRNLMFERKFAEAVQIGDGLGLNLPSIFQHVISGHIKRHDLAGAMEILEHPKCGLHESLQRILQEGSDRLVLHLALRYIQFKRSVPVIVERVRHKCAIFKTLSFQFTKVFARHELREAITEPSLALKFRISMENEVEEQDVDVLRASSKADFPKTVIFSFSTSFMTLLRQLCLTKDTVEENIDLPPCLELSWYRDQWMHLTHDGRINVDTGDIDVVSFAIRRNTLFVVSSGLQLYKTELPRVDFIALTDIHPVAKVLTNSDDAIFLSVSGSIFFEDGRYVVGEFVDAALGYTSVYGLNENGIPFRIVDRKDAVQIHVRCFVSAIATAGDSLVCLSTSGRVFVHGPQVVAIDLGFTCDLLKTVGDEAVCVGGGNAALVAADGTYKIVSFSDRVGRSLDITKDENGCLVICGTIGSPMRILAEPMRHETVPSVDDMRELVETYNRDYLLSIFDCGLWRLLMLILTGRFAECVYEEGLVDVVPLIGKLDHSTAAEVLHALIVQGKIDSLPDTVISSDYARECFAKHRSDVTKVNKDKLILLLPRVEVPGKNTVDGIGACLLQMPRRSAVLPSIHFKEGRLFVFSCGHALNEDEMLLRVTELKKLCEGNDNAATGRTLFDAYREVPMALQCPRCVSHSLRASFRK